MYVYVLGLVVIVAQPARFWLGMGLAGVPIAVALILHGMRGRRDVPR